MKKITFLITALICFSAGMRAQCIATLPYPAETIPSNNSGDPQLINDCVYTGNYSTLSNLTIDNEYVFSLASNGTPVEKFITITDIENNILASGVSPLTVPSISQTVVRVHYAENNLCGTQQLCLQSFVTATLTCPFPTNILISNVTTTTASFDWTAGGGETSWEVMVLPKGSETPLPTTTGSQVTGEPGYEVDNLEAGHRYEFYIRSDCGTEFSPWRGPYDFNAGCTPIAIFNENFDGVTDDELPTCWTALKVDTAPDTFIVINSLSNSAPNAVQMANGNSGPNAKIMLISPELSTVTTGSHRLKFYTRGYGPVSIQVGTVSATTADGVFTPITTINATPNYTEHTVNFMNYAGDDTFIAFRHANTSTFNPVFIDDIRWEAAPLCPDLTNIQMTALSQTSATIGWTPGGTETLWDVVYSETADSPDALTPITSLPTEPELTLINLQPNTTYKAWVRSNCGGTSGVGAWMNPITFTTACNAVPTLNETFETTDFGNLPECWSRIVAGDGIFNSKVRVVTSNPATGVKSVSLYDGDGIADPKIILASPSLNSVATATHRVKFYAKANGAATLEVGTMASPVSGSTFTPFQSITLTPTYAEFVVDFTTYTGTDNYIAFKHPGGMFLDINIDNIRWELTPSCIDVSGIIAKNTTPVSTVVDWNANAGETQWDVVYGGVEINDPTTLTPITPAPTVNSEATISGLTPNTVYNVWVRSVCGGPQGNGAWIGPVSFRTPCLAISEFSEGFETATIDELPNCWSSVLAGPTLGQYAAVRTVNHDSAFGNNAVELHANSSEPTDWIMLVSPYLNTLSTGTHRLKFYALSYNIGSALEIGTMNGNTSQSTYTMFQTLTLGEGYNEILIDFTTYTGSDSYIAFRNTAGNFNSVFIDNVRWELSPACPDVTDLLITDIGTGGATVNWESSGTEPNWQVVYAPVSVSDPSNLTPTGLLTDNSYQISGLDDNSVYNTWVRSACGGTAGFGSWIGPITFRTNCLPASVPYTEDFESSNVPSLPYCVSTQVITGNAWNTTWGDSGYGFDGYVLRYNGNSTVANSWFFTQGVQLTMGTEYVLSYKYGNNSSDNYTERLQVRFGNTPSESGMLEELADHTQINTGTAMTNTVTFVPSSTGAYYFGFWAYSMENQSQLFLDNISITPSLSVPGAEKGNLSWYPNPVKDALHLSNTDAITDVIVVNMIGQTVLHANPNMQTARVDVSHLPTGNYIVKVVADGLVKTLKVVKQ